MFNFVETVTMWMIFLLGLFGMYLCLVFLPVSLYSTGECLEKGYPESRTTLTLENYCINIGGATSGKVYKLGDEVEMLEELL